MNKTVENIQEWFKGKGLDKEDSKAQYGKLLEEVEELGEALAESDLNHITEELADVVIVTIGIALQQNIDFKQALEKGFNKIDKRKGIVKNGTFIKEEDLWKKE